MLLLTRRVGDRPVLLVVVVDDEPAARAVLGAVLRTQGCEVLLVSGGPEALEVYREHQGVIDLVLLAAQLAGPDAPTTLEALRAINSRVRCCVLSSDPEPEREKEWLNQGAAFVLAKPFTFDDIRALVGWLRAA